ncbi:unnamed protein product [Oppiella nova]|uniref:Alpha-macroglobulin receptor-binding domain-containing protein n=1 Tax=Oppiella nova TaxID=334625 RepID=A0A7R9M1P7_9ACAR|nr:unnamed protein product [Oppiella nova]CAG2169065.1 unnamed protein product [Oppiella nova]
MIKNMIQNKSMPYVDNDMITVSKMKIKIPKQPALHNNQMTRILMYYLDPNTNQLIADSSAFLTTCIENNKHITQISGTTDSATGALNLKLKTEGRSATCATRVSQNKPYYSLKRINEFIDKFNVRQEFQSKDKCEKMYGLKKMEMESNYSPYMAPYGLDSMATNTYDPVINYGDAWDAFNSMGLAVQSNTQLDDSPCDWDLYPTDILSQLNELKRNNQMKYVIKEQMINKPYAMYQMQDMERSLFNEVLDWNVVNTDDSTGSIDRQISHELVQSSQQLYADTVCVNKGTGITYASSVIDTNGQLMNKKKQSVRMTVMSAPMEARIGDSLVYKVMVEPMAPLSQMSQCLPVELMVEPSEYYDLMAANPKSQCICGQTGQPMQVVIKPKKVGAIKVKLMAKYATDMMADTQCSQTIYSSQMTTFEPQMIIKQLAISPMGIVSNKFNHQVVCNNHNNIVRNTESDIKIQDLSQMMSSSDISSNMIVTNDILEPMYTYIKKTMSVHNHNAMDSLSTYSAAYYLYQYLNNQTTSSWMHKKSDVMEEMSRAYQSLMTYRHMDGSYGMLKSRHRHDTTRSELGLTVSVFKVLAQSRPYMAYSEQMVNGQRVNKLKDTLRWIYGQQATDGCFKVNREASRVYNVWPMNFENDYQLTAYVLASLLESENDYQLTAYVLASLLESGLDYSSKPLYKAYNCLSQNSQQFLTNIDFKPLTAILYNYIQILSGNTLESDVWMKAVKKAMINHNKHNVNKNDDEVMDEVMVSYLALSALLSNDKSGAKAFGERLIHVPNDMSALWRTPISCYAITKLWPVMANMRSPATVETQHNIQSTGMKMSMKGRGCVMVANTAVKTQMATKGTYFDIKMNGLDNGVVSCNNRRLNVCIEERETFNATLHPVVIMQMVTGFEVDRNLLKKMMDDTEVITKYKRRGPELMLFMRPMYRQQQPSGQSSCFTVPVIQKHAMYGQNEAHIKIYDSFNEDINDVMAYKIPIECHIVSQ